jgi:hypothetical protein
MQDSFVKADRLRLSAHPSMGDAWLHARVASDPGVLGLTGESANGGGNLRLVGESHVRDGRLELVLHDGATGRRFTVVVRVAPADESDLLRAIVLWAGERESVPDSEHFAVLAAESFPPRVLAAATELGSVVPLTAMQLTALRVGEQAVLNFTRVIDRLPNRPETTGLGAVAVVPLVDHNGNDAEEMFEATTAPTTTAADASPTAPEPAPIHTDTGEEVVFSTQAIPVEARPRELPAPAPQFVEGHIAEPEKMTAAAAPSPSRAFDEKFAGTFLAQPRVPESESDSAGTRPRGRLLAVLGRASMLLCLVAAFGWVRSFYVRDVYTLIDSRGAEHMITSEHGRIDWISPRHDDDDAPSGITSPERQYVRIPYWLPVAITAILPAAWLIRRRSQRC